MTAAPAPACPLVTRRRFLVGLGAAATTVMVGRYAVSVFGSRPEPSGAAASPSLPNAPPGRTLVMVELGGGNDGLSMVVPHASGAYHDLRRDLAITDPIDLDGEIGLHPALGYVADRYRTGDLAVVEGVGYPEPDLSHFVSMQYWWAGEPGGTGETGWLGRYLDAVAGPDEPLAGITVGPGPSPAMLGRTSLVVSIQDASGLAPQIPAWIDTRRELLDMWSGFAPAAVDSPGLFGQVRDAISGTVEAAGRLDSALDSVRATTPRPDLAGQLALAAALVASDIAPRVVYVQGAGDFDTHQAQAHRHHALMAELDDGLRGFFSAVEAAGAAERVVVATASEFGRRPATNGSGTDHGTAAAHLVLGAPVGGGRYGQPLDLSRLDRRGNPVHTVDFRQLLATVADGWLGVDPAVVVAPGTETLPIFV